jgi:hypothetical protein
VLLVAVGLVVGTGCEQGKKPDQNSPKPDTKLTKSDGDTDPVKPGTDVKPAEDTKPDPVDPPKITLSQVDLAGYQQLVKSHTGKVVLTDAWATW